MREDSRKSENLRVRLGTCLPNEHVYYFDETLGRTSSFEPDQRLVVLLSLPDWSLMTSPSADVKARDNRCL